MRPRRPRPEAPPPLNCYTLGLPRHTRPRRSRRDVKLDPDKRGPYYVSLPDDYLPSARIDRMVAARPRTFLPNRRGWRRFYYYQSLQGCQVVVSLRVWSELIRQGVWARPEGWGTP